MKNRIIKLTEIDLERIVKKVINEDFTNRFASRGAGLFAKLKTLGRENRDTRQYLEALTRLKTSANQADYVLKDIQLDIDKLFKGKFQEKVQKTDSKLVNQEELKKDINELMSLLSEYKSALSNVVEVNDKIKSLGKSETPIPDTNTTNP